MPAKKFPPAEATAIDRDLTHCHILVQMRWPALRAILQQMFGLRMFLNEGHRSDVRQLWLYGAGRTADWLKARGLDPRYARPKELRVTNAWSSRLSAHGWMEKGKPAAAAIDAVPLGADGKPWTKDDPFPDFVAAVAIHGPPCGLVHFHAPGKAVWDMPHLQLVEWSDALHRLVLP